MIKEAIHTLAKRENLSYETALEVMNEIMEGKASQVQMSAYLTALSLKGETIEEITGSAAGMRAHCIKLLHDMDVLEKFLRWTGYDVHRVMNITDVGHLHSASPALHSCRTPTALPRRSTSLPSHPALPSARTPHLDRLIQNNRPSSVRVLHP